MYSHLKQIYCQWKLHPTLSSESIFASLNCLQRVVPVSVPSYLIFCHSLLTKMHCHPVFKTSDVSLHHISQMGADHSSECKSTHNSPQIPHKCRILSLFSSHQHHKMQLPGKTEAERFSATLSCFVFHLECIYVCNAAGMRMNTRIGQSIQVLLQRIFRTLDG